MTGRTEELARVRSFVRAHADASATHTRAWSSGTAVFHEGLPLVYDLNYLRLERDGGLTAKAIAAEADELMSSPALGHREVVAEDEAAGERLSEDFRALGWKVDRHVIMAYHSQPDRSSDTSEVHEVDETTVWPSREKFLRTYEWCNDDATASQMHAAYRIWMRTGKGRDLAIERDGAPVSFAMLWSDGVTAQIEDVATLELYRNQGLSRAVIAKALEIAFEEGHETVFLIADEEDWPKLLYRKLGFEEIGCNYYFVKVNS